MAIWQQTPDLETLNRLHKNTIGELLDIRFEAFDGESLTASMVVDPRTRQPYGVLHGGATVVLAETVGSMASYLCLDPVQFYCVGLEVNANHLRSVAAGRVVAVARAIHLGRSTHVWDIRICDEQGRNTCISRLTTAIVPVATQPPVGA